MEWRWTNKVTESGWYAWKNIETISQEPIGINYFSVDQNGTESFVNYFYYGNGKRQRLNEPLPFLVCPVAITPKQ